MLAFTLELLNFFLLFKLVLGYKFREKPWSIIVAAALILVHYVAFIVFPDEVLLKLDYLWLAIPVIIIPFLFQGRVLVTLGVGLSLRCVMPLVEYLTRGIYLIMLKHNAVEVDLVLTYNLSQIVCILIIGILAFILRTKRSKVRLSVERINVWILFLFVVCMQVLNLDAGYSGDIPEDQVQIVHGINLSKSGILAVLVVIIFSLIFVLINQKKELKRSLILNERCIQEQTEQYRLLSQGDKSLRKFRHDYNEHVAVLHSLAQSGEAEALSNYVEQLGAIKNGLKLIFTNNIICDAIINRYDRICQDENIRLLVNGKFPDRVSISETALCVLLSNGLKNAYEAVQKCPENREIQFDVRNTDSCVFITIENSVNEPLIIENGVLATTKPDTPNHGYGTQNMLETARKAGGDVTWRIGENGYIITEIMIGIYK